MLLFAFGCKKKNAKDESVDVGDLAVPVYTDSRSMVIRADLPPNLANREQMMLYKECGFNAVPLTEDFFSASEVAPYIEAMKQYEEDLAAWDGNEETKPVEPTKPLYIVSLELCEELGIDVYIRPHQKDAFVNVPNENNIAVFNEYLETPNYFEKYFYNLDFRDYPAVKGFFIVDEPLFENLLDLKYRYLPWFNENYGDGNFEMIVNFLNPLSNLWKDSRSQNMTLDQFMTYYNDNFFKDLNSKDKTVSFDTYVLCNDGVDNYIKDTFLYSTMCMRKYANQYNADFGTYIQCFTGYSNLRDLTSVEDFNYQINVYLAFGSERIAFYGYRDYPPEEHMLTAGEPNEKWDYCKDAIGLLKKIDGILYNFTWEGIFTNVGTGSFFEINEAFDAIKNDSLKELRGVSAIKSKYDIVVGQFKDKDNNDGFMLVNYEEPSINHTNKVSMTFKNADGVLYYRNGERFVESLKNRNFEIELNPGEGVFIVPVYKK